jgi:hypothetical protein
MPCSVLFLAPQGFSLDLRAGATGDADADERAPVGQRLDAVHQVLPADRASLRGSDSDRYARRDSRIEPLGNRPGHHGRYDPLLGVGAACVQRHHLVADCGALDSLADLGHRAGAEIADDVRGALWRRGRAGEQITALNADRLYVHQALIAGYTRTTSSRPAPAAASKSPS